MKWLMAITLLLFTYIIYPLYLCMNMSLAISTHLIIFIRHTVMLLDCLCIVYTWHMHYYIFIIVKLVIIINHRQCIVVILQLDEIFIKHVSQRRRKIDRYTHAFLYYCTCSFICCIVYVVLSTYTLLQLRIKINKSRVSYD